ncbi:MBL fold metallo-hydrolase [Sphingopyxis sp. 22461]|uniref:MBL fold metallo-hydrolase n=1 Tax=Sphingopyxis sp. 22461 TaxID=3453923 RepID=UPI003F84A80A
MTSLHQVAPNILVALDRRVPLVPNIGIISGTKAILVVDVGLGRENGKRVYQAALRIANGRRIYLTTTHFHPEHSFGASAFPRASLIMNAAQLDELQAKGPAYLELFRKIGPAAQSALVDTVPAETAVVYRHRHIIDLGGTVVELREVPAHTRGDQVIFVPESRVLFTGDLAETRFFPVLVDKDSNGSRWIDVLGQLIALRPAVIVPGHGEVTDRQLLDDVREMLIWMRAEVDRAVEKCLPTETMVAEIVAAARRRYPGWDNGQYLSYDVLSFRNDALAKNGESGSGPGSDNRK